MVFIVVQFYHIYNTITGLRIVKERAFGFVAVVSFVQCFASLHPAFVLGHHIIFIPKGCAEVYLRQLFLVELVHANLAIMGQFLCIESRKTNIYSRGLSTAIMSAGIPLYIAQVFFTFLVGWMNTSDGDCKRVAVVYFNASHFFTVIADTFCAKFYVKNIDFSLFIGAGLRRVFLIESVRFRRIGSVTPNRVEVFIHFAKIRFLIRCIVVKIPHIRQADCGVYKISYHFISSEFSIKKKTRNYCPGLL